jgi:hypothetical protein
MRYVDFRHKKSVIRYDQKTLMKALTERIHELDFQLIESDLAPFLQNKQELDYLKPQYLEKLLVNLT